MEQRDSHKYQALSRIITSPADPEKATSFLSQALNSAIEAMDISAASIVILSDDGKSILNIREGDPQLQAILASLEERMIGAMRSEFGMENIYSTLNHEGEKSLFSYMIKSGEKTLGTVSGICEGSRNIALEEEFISVIASALRHVFAETGRIKTARVQAVKETTVTLNHEINNPLTAVLGNVQLLLMREDDLSDEVINRLKLIEEGSLRIRDVINQLMKAADARTATYIEDTSMIDLGEKDESDD